MDAHDATGNGQRGETADRGSEPTLRQTMVAALAGPFLVAFVAGIMAVMLGTGPARATSASMAAKAPSAAATIANATAHAHAAESKLLTAKPSSMSPRGKALTAATYRSVADGAATLRQNRPVHEIAPEAAFSDAAFA